MFATPEDYLRRSQLTILRFFLWIAEGKGCDIETRTLFGNIRSFDTSQFYTKMWITAKEGACNNLCFIKLTVLLQSDTRKTIFALADIRNIRNRLKNIPHIKKKNALKKRKELKIFLFNLNLFKILGNKQLYTSVK